MFKKRISNGSNKFTREERSWILYDVANSAYTLTVVTVLFPILLLNVASKNNVSTDDATAYTQYAKSIYSIIVAILAPILGTFADYKGQKKKMFMFFLVIGIVGGFILCIPGLAWQAILVIYIFATVGYAGANVFYDAFLTDVTTDERMDKVSSTGYGYGYIGSTIPFIAGMIFFVIARFTDLGLDQNIAINIAFFISVVWWALFSIPIIRNVKQLHYIEPVSQPVKMTFIRLFTTFRNIKKYKKIFVFLIAYFFYIDAVDTIISAAIPVGKAMNVIDDTLLMAIVLIIQFIAFPFALLFGRLTKRFGAPIMISVAIGIYTIVCILGYLINSAMDIVVIAILIGTAQGGIQSISRSYFGKLLPKAQSNEFFGFFNIFGKFAAILGPIIVGRTIQITGNPRDGMLGIVPLLIIGFVLFIISTRMENDDFTVKS